MEIIISSDELQSLGLTSETAQLLQDELNAQIKSAPTAEQAWLAISRNLSRYKYPFKVHLFIYNLLFPNWRTHPELAPIVIPTVQQIGTANITQFMSEIGITNVQNFHQWTVKDYGHFWERITKQLGIIFKKPYQSICNLEKGIEVPQWFAGGKLNIVDSCFQGDLSHPAVIYQDQNQHIAELSYDELNRLSNRIANGLRKLGCKPLDHIGICMPMTKEAVAIYLAIIKLGAVVVAIPDSFSEQEISLRLKIIKTSLMFTQNSLHWNNKTYPLYKKLHGIPDLSCVVLPLEQENINLRQQDQTWESFLSPDDTFTTYACDPDTSCNVLFSSGTSAEPKAIAWTHTTPIKIASDAFFHQNVQAQDRLLWPTNLGWMMGPWLIFAALINKATLVLYSDVPKTRALGEFIQDAKVTMLGVVPTIVASWRQTECMENLNWENIKVFSSTGECSNPTDMLYLSALAGYKPVIEYCGGTEIGGAYISSTVVENCYPSLFSTPVMGIDFMIINSKGKVADCGDVALLPPSIGLSTTLLNADHYKIYYSDMPKIDNLLLRRHGDKIKRFSNGYFSILGRSDDSMNLGGIKISAAEIERVLSPLPEVEELAAIGVSQSKMGPQQLIIYVVAKPHLDESVLYSKLQQQINKELNPFFKIHEIIVVDALPKTASNKIMRRQLRNEYQKRIIPL
ncbi:MAG: AMP-binding protein [Gammaproteobacteria bacterium]|nr:AMP-binding protein [Gammaproteobacteria bacterium]